MGNKQTNILELYKDPRLINAIQKWNIFEFLDNHNVDYIMDGKNVGTEFIGVRPCPFCGDNRNHFGIHKERKYGSCFLCKGYAGPLKLISYYGHMNIQNSFDYLVHNSEDDRDIEEKVREIIYTKKETIEYTPNKKDILPNNIKPITIRDIHSNKFLKNLLNEKKLRIWDINKYNINLLKNEIIYPIYLKGKPVSYQKRSISFKRYYNPKNLPNYLYGEDEIIPNKSIILVEGFFDYTRIYSYIRINYPKQISVTTGMLKSISKQQINRLININPPLLIVMFDNDSWFDYYRLKNTFPFNVDFIILPKNSDPNNLSWTQLDNIFKNEISL